MPCSNLIFISTPPGYFSCACASPVLFCAAIQLGLGVGLVRGIVRYGVVCLLLVFAVSAYAQTAPAPLIADADHRQSVSLDGAWHAIVDPYNVGYLTYRYEPRDDGFFQNLHPDQEPNTLIEYNFAASPTLNVPGDWNSQRPDLFFYEGPVWYEKDFSYHPKPGTRVFLRIGAANYFSRVWVNGDEACEHAGGFTPFNCEVTNLLDDGDNFAVISVDNTRLREGVPALNTDWWNYGGLTRDVELVEVPSLFISDYFLQMTAGTQDEISGWVQLRRPVAPTPIRIRIPELKIDEQVASDSTGKAKVKFNAPGLIRWSPENPKLYDVEISAGSDDLHDLIGFRTIEVRGTDILLNGQPIFLRGVSIQEEAPYRSGRAYSEEDARTLLGWVKELGANYVRLTHFPHSEHMLRLADQMGIMVWSEVPVYWTIDWSSPEALANARQQLTEMIARDKNRAAVILWSMSNESPPTPERVQFVRSLIETARSLDSTRLITAALEDHAVGNTSYIDDPLGADVDVLGCNEYIGWYTGKVEDLDHTVWKTPYDKPLIMSEFGADAKFGLHGSPDQIWTEEYQANLYEHQFHMLDNIAFLRGMSPWVLMDFRSPRRLLPGIQDYYNRKGLVSDKGEKKKAFFVLRDYYAHKGASPQP
jgi:beta-glucuronidase